MKTQNVIFPIIILLFSFCELLIFNEEVLLLLSFLIFIYFNYVYLSPNISDFFSHKSKTIEENILNALEKRRLFLEFLLKNLLVSKHTQRVLVFFEFCERAFSIFFVNNLFIISSSKVIIKLSSKLNELSLLERKLKEKTKLMYIQNVLYGIIFRWKIKNKKYYKKKKKARNSKV